MSAADRVARSDLNEGPTNTNMASDTNTTKTKKSKPWQVVTEREIITQILKQYKHFSCLWDSSDKNYFNKQVRTECYELMLESWQQLQPNGTVETLKKRLEHIRSAYRREWKKVANSMASAASPENIHKPNLWYYNQLSFLNMESDNLKDSTDEEGEEKSCEDIPPKKKRRIIKTKKHTLHSKEAEHQQGMPESNKSKSSTEADDYVTTYGLTIARQLKELDDEVRYEAERVISDVIYRARTGTLPKYSPPVIDNLFIPQSGPSWYDMPLDQPHVKQHTNCLVIAEPSENIIKTELVDTEQY